MRIESKSIFRGSTYVFMFALLFIVFWLLRSSDWLGSKQLHTLMELLATALAAFIGSLSLIRHYSKKSNTFLFIGVGFLGTALLDGYHGIVTSTFFENYFPSIPSQLIPWSWNASRTFLAILMVFSWWAWRREEKLGESGRVSEKLVYYSVGLLTLVSFIFFAFAPLPRAYYPELIFGRPEEFLAATFFLIALIGYLKKGLWRSDYFEYWLVLSLIVGFMGQALFMPYSFRLFDGMFDIAHLLKKVSYLYVLIGLMISMFFLFREAEEGREKLAQHNVSLDKEKEEAEKLQKIAEESNSKAESMNRVMVGREIKMIELKREIFTLKKRLKEGSDSI